MGGREVGNAGPFDEKRRHYALCGRFSTDIQIRIPGLIG